MRQTLLTLACVLVLGGCAADEPITTSAAGASATSAGSASTGTSAGAGSPAASSGAPASADPSASAGPPASRGAYIEYAAYRADPAAYTGDVVLFFHASWCPSCKATHASLTGDGVPDGLTVVKVDYDTETDLKKKYKITHQHTFVAVDPSGNQLAKWSGSFTGAEIKAKADA